MSKIVGHRWYGTVIVSHTPMALQYWDFVRDLKNHIETAAGRIPDDVCMLATQLASGSYYIYFNDTLRDAVGVLYERGYIEPVDEISTDSSLLVVIGDPRWAEVLGLNAKGVRTPPASD